MKIISDVPNLLLKRNEVVVELDSQKNPSFIEVIDILTKQFKKDAECIAVKSIKGSFGSSKFSIGVNLYDTKADKDRTEPKRRDKKKQVEGFK